MYTKYLYYIGRKKRDIVGINSDNDVVECENNILTRQLPDIILTKEKDDNNTTTSELESITSSKKKKTGESLLLCDWVRKSLFKYCKFVTSNNSMDYRQPLCLFTLEENNVSEGKQKWWNTHKRDIVKMLNEKRGCMVESLKAIFKSKYIFC